MSIPKHHNFTFSGSPSVPVASGDRYYSQDMIRDFYYHLDSVGKVLRELGGTVPFLLSGGIVSKGSGDTLNITAGKGVCKYTVTIPDDSAVTPATVTTYDLEGVLVEWTAQTNMAIPSATLNGVATNYVKVAYAETDSSSRTRAKKAGSYPVEKIPSFAITVDTTAPTDYQVCIAQFVGTAGGSFSISVYASLRSLKSLYDVFNNNITIAGTKTFSNAIVGNVTGNTDTATKASTLNRTNDGVGVYIRSYSFDTGANDFLNLSSLTGYIAFAGLNVTSPSGGEFEISFVQSSGFYIVFSQAWNGTTVTNVQGTIYYWASS